jgi:hypothetical protein
MNSQAARPDFVLTRRLADGATELIPIGVAHEESALAGAAYSLIDRNIGFDSPAQLVAQRQGTDLILLIDGAQVLVIDEFFSTEDVIFYPSPDIIGGAGPFSGERLTPETPALAPSSGEVQTLWSAEPMVSAERVTETGRNPDDDDDQDGGISPLVWVGLGVGVLGAAAGGGGGGGSSSGAAPVAAEGSADTDPPQITSASTTDPIEENSGAGQIVYTATATDSGTITWELTGTDAAAFAIDPDSGAVTLIDNPDFEMQASYSFTVVATDSVGNSSLQAVVLSITDQDDVAPVITSGASAENVDENSGADQVVYVATAETAVSWSLARGDDSGAFAIDTETGEVTLLVDPDFETQASYTFTVVASDAAGNSSEQSISLGINDVIESRPEILSGPTAAEIEENSGPDQVIYTAIADVDVTWRLAPGDDADGLRIDALSGAVTLEDDPDFEVRSSYAFTVIARDDNGAESEQAVTLSIGNLDEVAPTITSGNTAPDVDENSGAGQVVYTVTSTDDGDISSGSTSYSLGSGGDADAFTIDPNTGAVTLTANPDFESQADYDFTVIATDAAGNSSELDVSLAINDVVEASPAVVSVALTEALGAQNGILNTGDTVRITVSMSTDVFVDSAGGTPRVELDIGGDTAFADFVSGSGTSTLVFEYVIGAGDNDADGIRIRPDSIQANGATLTSALGTPANLEHDNVRSNPDFVVDTLAPVLRSSDPKDDEDDVDLDASIELQFSEDVAVGSGNIFVSDGTDTRVIDVTDSSQVSFDEDRVIIDLAEDLDPSRNYNVQVEEGAVTDKAGNAFAGISDTATLDFDTEPAGVDTSIVVFDLVQGTSSDHSGRSFDSGVSYDIYIRVDSDDSALSTAGDGPGSWGRWDGVDNLGSDDRIILVGDGGPVAGRFTNPVEQIRFEEDFIAWESGGSFRRDAARVEGSSFARITGGFFRNEENVRLFDSALGDDFFAGQTGNLNTRYLTSMPAGVLTSQGLV